MVAPVVVATGARTAGSAGALPAEGTKARQHRDAIDAIKDARPAEPTPAPADAVDVSAGGGGVDRSKRNSRPLPDAFTHQRGTPGWLRPDLGRSANAGGGFVLGLLTFTLVRSYLLEGADGPKKWLRAKFLNDVDYSR